MITGFENYELRLIKIEELYEFHMAIDENREFLSEYLEFMKEVNLDSETGAIKKWQNMYEMGFGFEAGIFLEDRLIGMCGLRINKDDDRGEIGYWLVKDQVGKGIMTRMVKQVLDLGFCDYGLNKISIKCVDDNFKSQNVAKRLGFHFDGILRGHQKLHGRYRDLFLFSMLKREWEALYT